MKNRRKQTPKHGGNLAKRVDRAKELLDDGDGFRQVKPYKRTKSNRHAFSNFN